MTKRNALVGAIIIAGAALMLIGCASPQSSDPETSFHPEPSIVSPTTDMVSGTWNSTSTEGVSLAIGSDNSLALTGSGCAASGTWSVDGEKLAVAIDLIPGVGGCPSSFTVDRSALTSITILNDGELRLWDSDGHQELFTR